MTRQEAIDTLSGMYQVHVYWETGEDFSPRINKALDMAIEALETQGEAGKWVLTNGGVYECSKCGKVPVNKVVSHGMTVMDYTGIKVNEAFRYCPKCGAKMEGVV